MPAEPWRMQACAEENEPARETEEKQKNSGKSNRVWHDGRHEEGSVEGGTLTGQEYGDCREQV